MIAASFLNNEMIAITDEEAQKLADATTAVTELYDIPLLSEKAMAWTQLAATMGSIYGPRIGAMLIQEKITKQKRQPPPTTIDGSRL